VSRDDPAIAQAYWTLVELSNYLRTGEISVKGTNFVPLTKAQLAKRRPDLADKVRKGALRRSPGRSGRKTLRRKPAGALFHRSPIGWLCRCYRHAAPIGSPRRRWPTAFQGW